MSLLPELADYLSSGGITNVFAGQMPDTPAACVSVERTGGRETVHAMGHGPGDGMERPRVQVLVLAEGRPAAEATANAVARLLDGMPDRILGSVHYFWAAAVQPPFFAGEDANGRPVVAANYDVCRARSTA